MIPIRLTIRLCIFMVFNCSLWGQGSLGAPVEPMREFLAQYCARCHEGASTKGGFDLSMHLPAGIWSDDEEPRLPSARSRFIEVMERVRGATMPPPRAIQPEPSEREAFLLAGAAYLGVNGRIRAGHVTLRRLSRAEWSRCIEIILGLQVEDLTRLLPEDPSAYGFDNVGDVLFVTPSLLETYLSATNTLIGRFSARVESRARWTQRGWALNEPQSYEELRRFLRSFLGMAWRRPPTEAEIDRRSAMYWSAYESGARPEAALRPVILSVLVSPSFLFRVERGAPSVEADAHGEKPLSDHEIASRLSFFLAGGLPENRLATLALTSGKLQQTEVLRGEVRHMISSDSVSRFTRRFSTQWLGIQNLSQQAVDFRRFKFSSSVRRAMLDESVRVFQHCLQNNLPIRELINGRWTYLNAPLAKHYGIDGVDHWGMKRVELGDSPRGGLLGQGAVLAATSFPLRTSPVHRGKWILERLLGTPPPPPPPNAGTLPPDDRQKDGLTLRARLELHRKSPACFSCHSRMDPLGLALENFDGIGRWRTENAGKPIVSAVSLFDGTKIEQPSDLKQWLVSQERAVAKTLLKQLFVYAIGRPAELEDEPALLAILKATANTHYRLADLVEQLVLSRPFRYLEIDPK